MTNFKLYFILLYVLWICESFAKKQDVKNGTSQESNTTLKYPNTHEETSHRFQVAHLAWDHVKDPFTVALWLLLAGLAKIGFHLWEPLPKLVPDSTLLILLGLFIGGILYGIHLTTQVTMHKLINKRPYENIIAVAEENAYHLSETVFFLFLLPPIVFDAGYFMPMSPFFNNLGTILVYAVIGTIFNTFAIGLSLWGCGGLFTKAAPPLLHLLLFGALISAVDPVAVLVVFEEIHVNQLLFIVVFGESLLNDAVTVVLYRIFSDFSIIGAENLKAIDFFAGIASFFVVAVGGVIIGLIWGFLTALVTRCTNHVRVLEPFFVFLMAYCSYLTAETFGLSGILAIHHEWDTAFVLFTILFCIIYRVIGVVVLTFIVNKKRLKKLDWVSQFIMAYGGLRGAVAYGLVESVAENVMPPVEKDMFVTATIAVIFFTVFIQGTTIKWLVNCLKVQKTEKEPNDLKMTHEFVSRTMNHTTAGIEEIIGKKFGKHFIFEWFDYYNSKYMMRCLVRKSPKTADEKLVKMHTQLEVKEAVTLAKNTSFVGISVFAATKRSDSQLFNHHNHGKFSAYLNPSFTRDESSQDVQEEKKGTRPMHPSSTQSLKGTREHDKEGHKKKPGFFLEAPNSATNSS